jgi:hypothetical protein
MRPYIQKYSEENGLERWLRIPDLQAQSPEFQLQFHKKNQQSDETVYGMRENIFQVFTLQ